MRPQINRLPPDAPKGLAGQAIDRARPLQFHLDGREIHGFHGDTVLSAVLATGIDTSGVHRGHRLALSPSAAPAIAYAGQTGDHARALPMARTPALHGAEFVTLAGRPPWSISRLFQPGRTLGLDLDDPLAFDRPWLGAERTKVEERDVVVVGGGVAGLSAALTAARAGQAVTLVEASPQLGGCSGLFGTQDGEDAPEVAMARLASEVDANPAIAVHLSTEVFALRQGLVRAHRMDISEGTAKGAVIDIEAPRIVLATGANERLPIFAGNRLPGVSGTLDTYELASRYGVWPGRSLVVATASNASYRLAVLAHDVGVAVHAILDGRPHPSSRFIDFAKAYGIHQMTAAQPHAVQANKAGSRLSIEVDGSMALATERLVACGGWQPDLTLWHIAGGASRWNEQLGRIEATEALNGIALAGSAAGYRTRQGCIQSGADAVDALLGRDRRPVADPVIDPLYETPDAILADANERTASTPTYLDSGMSLLTRPAPPRKRWYDVFRATKTAELPALSEASHPLTLGTIAAGVALGLIPARSAGIVAQERVAFFPLAEHGAGEPHSAPEPPEAAEIPEFLQDRFGPDAGLRSIAAEDGRRLSAGSLIFADADTRNPLVALGVVLRANGAAATALVSSQACQNHGGLFVRDHGQYVAIALEPISA